MSEASESSQDQEQDFTPVELVSSVDTERLSEFVFEGQTLPVTYVESQEVKEGVTCDIYAFDGDKSKDLAIVRVAKGFKTPNQEVVDGNKTVEGLVSGDGVLTVRSPGNTTRMYDFDGDDEHQGVGVKVGETMQWSANGDSDLTFYEVCDPPYQDGRFKDLPDPSFSPTPPDAKIGDHPMSSFNLNAHGENLDCAPGDEAGPDLTPSPELQAELADRQVITDRESGQSYGFIELNRGVGPANEALVSLMSFGVDTQNPAANYELEQIALQSGKRTIVYETLSVGASDKLTSDQREALERGDFSPLARGMLGAMKAQGLTQIDLEGFSMGARTAMAIAAHAEEFGITIKSLILFDPPGFVDHTTSEMYKRILYREGMHNRPAYADLVEDECARATLDSVADTTKIFAKMAVADVRGNALSYPKGLGRETALDDLIKALETQPALKLTIISGGASEISTREEINAAYRQLKESYPEQVSMVRLAGDTHAMQTGGARRIGWHVARILKQKA